MTSRARFTGFLSIWLAKCVIPTREAATIGVLLPTGLPVLGERADLASLLPVFAAGLRNSPLRYLGAKLVYVCRRTSP